MLTSSGEFQNSWFLFVTYFSAWLHHFGPDLNISTTIGWIATNGCTDINPNNFGDSLTFPLVSPAGFNSSCEISQHLIDGLAQNVLQTFTVSRRGIVLSLDFC